VEPISLEALNAADRDTFVAALGEVMEHSPWVAETAFAVRPFANLEALYQAMIGAVRRAGAGRQLDLIKQHPELAGKVAREGALGADSAAEQSSVGLNRLTPEELTTFHRLNSAYSAKFGIPFIVCVRRHSKDSILREFARRLDHDAATEREAALTEIFRIAALRLDQRVAAPEKLKVNGWLSTHVLDTYSGCPAAGVVVDLCELAESGAAQTLVRVTTNADGRTDRPLIAGRPLPIAVYELRFDVGAYFKHRAAAVSEPPFLGIVPVRFAVAEPESHYHVPLLVTPWSYSTYRGS
jgi:2-oxo-4-hydroxy-4-carboxy-5-ureidoimidazoline decarboxylase